MHKEPLQIVKIGGNVIDEPTALQAFLETFSRLEGHKILVHGGGKLATRLANQLHVFTDMIDGKRITTAEMLDVATMVYAGLTNKTIVAILQSLNCDAIGFSGADANIIRTVKRPAGAVDYGFVGDITADSVDNDRMQKIVHLGLSPVFCAITHDGKGQLLNTNADKIASALAINLARFFEVSLIYCFEMPGVLKDIHDNASVINHLNINKYHEYKASGIIADGMIPKLDNAFAAIARGVHNVQIKHADDLLSREKGTIIT